MPQPSWLDLHELLQNHVPSGAVVFYAELEKYFCGTGVNAGLLQELIRSCANHGKPTHLHRIVRNPTGDCAELLGLYPGGPAIQRQRLKDGGVQFSGDNVDLKKTPAVFFKGKWQPGRLPESTCRLV